MHKCYQVRTYLSSQMTFMKQLTFIKSDDIFKDSRYVHCLSPQKAEHVYQVTTLNEFINELVHVVICHLTCDPVSYHLLGVSLSFTRAAQANS